MKESYTINDIALMSGLTTRTLRNYIKMGLLEGQKEGGAWKFSPEAVDRFLEHPCVLPSIQAKKNAIVFDFMADKYKKTEQICIILDIPGKDSFDASRYFIGQYNAGSYGNNLILSVESSDTCSRVILKGQLMDVVHLMNLYRQRDNPTPELDQI